MEEKNKYLKGFDRANKRRMLTAALDQIRRKGEAGIGVPNCSCCFSFPIDYRKNGQLYLKIGE